MKLSAGFIVFFFLLNSVSHAAGGDGYKGEARFVFRNLERFEEWPATEEYKSIADDIDWSSHKDAKKFKTRLQEGLEKGPNYAGKYAVITHGCGSSCQVNWIVDVENGKVVDVVSSTYGVQYKKDSRLLVADLPINDDHTIYLDEVVSIAPRFYIIDGDYLDLYWIIDFCDFKVGCDKGGE